MDKKAKILCSLLGTLLVVIILVSGCMIVNDDKSIDSPDDLPLPELTMMPTHTVVTSTSTFVPEIATPTLTRTPFIETATPTPDPEFYLYKVQEGDNLVYISGEFRVPANIIAQYNQLGNPDLIYPGQELKIPKAWQDDPVLNKRIVVNLSEQMLYAYEEDNLIFSFQISSGKEGFETPKDTFFIYEKVELAHMVGPGYDTDNVPWVMSFTGSFSIHGAYWHNSFGTPVSHGCINLRVDDAKALYDWAPLYTPVEVVRPILP